MATHIYAAAVNVLRENKGDVSEPLHISGYRMRVVQDSNFQS